MVPIIKYVTVCILLIFVLYTDTKKYTIYNSVIILFSCIGLVLNYIESGYIGLINWFIGLILPIIILFILFMLRTIGAGDIKLIAVISSLLGINFIVQASIYILISATIMSIIKMIINRNLFIRIKHFFNFIHNIIINKEVGIYDELNKGDKNKIIRLSYAISIGTIYQIIADLKIL
ncbi:MAG: prepilin peptidase [Vallitalea sp.]|nr:prepilin peptidase [Vallitalea sp.]